MSKMEKGFVSEKSKKKKSKMHTERFSSAEDELVNDNPTVKRKKKVKDNINYDVVTEHYPVKPRLKKRKLQKADDSISEDDDGDHCFKQPRLKKKDVESPHKQNKPKPKLALRPPIVEEIGTDEDEAVESPHKQNKPKSKLPLRPPIVEVIGTDEDELEISTIFHKKPKGKANNEEPQDETIDWPQNDLIEFIKRIEAAIPEKDNLAYSTRAEKLNWDDIAFRNYTGSECKQTWQLIQKRVRRFRLLGEVLQDAKEWIRKPWTNFYRGNKTKRHPDMPRRPLSVYMLFYLSKKDKILAENPGLEMTEVSKKIALMYKNISVAKREKYLQLAAEERKKYEEKLEAFYHLHPEFTRARDERPTHPKHAEIGPKKPLTPFALFYEEQLKLLNNRSVDFHKFKEQCKRQWKDMSDKKKVIWIDWTLENEAKYQDELKNYKSQHPSFNPAAMKPILTKEEKLLKERLAGKPIKPPNSAYSLFSRMMLQSEEIKGIAPKDRMKSIADQWKNCLEREKKQYQERVSHLTEQYKLDFASYLESLSEDKRQEELRNTLPKRKRGPNEAEEPRREHEEEEVVHSRVVNENAPPNNSLKRKKTSESNLPAKKKKKTNELNKLPQEPQPPPLTPFKLFASTYRGGVPAGEAWQYLSRSEKKQYKTHVDFLNKNFISNYQVLSYNKKAKKNDDEESDIEDSDTSSSSDSSDSSSSSISSSSDSDSDSE